MRIRKGVDAELGLLVAVHGSIREQGGEPSIGQIEESGTTNDG